MRNTTLVLGTLAIAVVAGCARTREVIITQTPAAAPAPAVVSAPPAVIVADAAPPAPISETASTPPSAGAVWISGYWSWANGRYDWVPGHWETARSGYVWQPHQWELVNGRWQLTGGTWVPR